MYVKVRFVEQQNASIPRTYDYYSDLELTRGDYVLVPSAFGFGLAKVVKVMESSAKATKLVVQKIDVASWMKRKKVYESSRGI